MTESAIPLPVLPAANATTPATVLVVDDEPNIQSMLVQFLEMEGYHVVTADDGEAALAAVEAEAPDVILLDVMMPEMDGLTVCRRLKSQPQTMFIPVVILTSLRDTKDRIRGVEAGADEFLSKPFNHIELITRVKSLLRVKRLNDQLQLYNQELEHRVAERTSELKHTLEELRVLDRLKSEFIANVSHELRTPLMHVKGYVDLLADGALGHMTAEQKRGLKVTQEAIEHLAVIVEDILDFSEVRQLRLTLGPVAVPGVCQNVMRALAPLAERRNVTIETNFPADLPPVKADATALTRVIRHLLDNAIKFSPGGGVVHLTAERHYPLIRISVQDHGPGIPEDQQEHIFQMLYQIDGSATRHTGGIGMGLAVVKKLVEAHNAIIQLKSEAGQGSTFYFDLEPAG